MASVFTYDPDPPRVASPWLNSGVSSGLDAPVDGDGSEVVAVRSVLPEHSRVTHLPAEPQEGPVEYKLHLLLRPRRKFRSISTGVHVSGSTHSNGSSQPSAHALFGPTPEAQAPPSASTQQTRQHRLEQLTTQLLWRLQQSSPHHSSSATNIILPSLPEALPELTAPHTPAKLLHGLEESEGALYEIGVSDDGTLVGLAEDEMQESLNNLRAMAACLGCTVELLREEIVGECEWLEEHSAASKERRRRRTGRLMVSEALIKPYLASEHQTMQRVAHRHLLPTASEVANNEPVNLITEQLRVTLAGPTMSGKSSLLGTLTTSTLDNGRGKSRISLLKHRHELSSGITSSLTQELVGFAEGKGGTVEVINYAADYIASWIDMHVAAKDSRLVLITDSAGHPRYRRTTMRGLIGWAPHWTLFCVSADDTATIVPKVGLGQNAVQDGNTLTSDIDLSGAQLQICLRLGLPLIIAITKLDVASKAGLKGTLTKILDAVKITGRRPAIVPNVPSLDSELNLQTIGPSSMESAYKISLPLLNDPTEAVPIVLTSAVDGTGVEALQALLHELPMPVTMQAGESHSVFMFCIEDVYSRPTDGEGIIVSGRLRAGRVSIGDTGTVGPFSTNDWEDSERSDTHISQSNTPHLATSRSFPGAFRASTLARPRRSLPHQDQEWRRFVVTSIRNLRLPVHSLLADQAGTIAIVPEPRTSGHNATDPLSGMRKGMVLTDFQPATTRSFGALFNREHLDSLAVGNHVVVYIASVRASARVVSAQTPDSPMIAAQASPDEFKAPSLTVPDFYETSEANHGTYTDPSNVAGAVTTSHLLVTFTFDAHEFILVGDQVLIMPGGGPGLYGGQERGEKGLAGMEGFVGIVQQVYS